MKNIRFTVMLIGLLAMNQAFAQNKQPVDYADPFIGTSESRWMLNPGVTLPFGMVQLSPDNQSQYWKAGYEYTIGSVFGFSHLHAWTMSGLSVMPTKGWLNPFIFPHADAPISTGWEGTYGHRSRIDKNTEEASPGYYSVNLEDFDIKTELTSTTRCGFFRFTFPETDEGHVFFNLLFPQEYKTEILDARITKISDTEIEGYSHQLSAGFNDYTLHFVARFNKPFKLMGGWNWEANSNSFTREMRESIQNNITEISGKGDVGAYVDFETEEGEVVLLQTGISLVSIDQARLNLEEEMIKPFGWDFESVRADSRKIWNELLGKIEVSGGSEQDKTKFYTNLYRSYVARAILSDVNGKYMDPCELEKQSGSPMLGCDAFWNTFWNLNQLWTLVNPDMASMWVKSLLQMYRDGGWLPRGPAGLEYSGIMVASHSIPLIVSAYQKGIRDFDVETAWEAILHQQTVPGQDYDCGGEVGNKQLEPYLKYGYVPTEAVFVSNTLEYAYDDWCVAQFAKALGKRNEFRTFSKRAQYYRNIFDSETKYMRPRHEDGSWREDFDPFSSPGYVEGNAWQYTFFVPHDVQGLVELIGKEEFNQRLNDGFEKSRKENFNATGDRMEAYYINHGNQPNMQAAYLFNYSGKPWLTQKWTREIMDRYYGSTPLHGWLGDEDEGQMGGWYVMSAIGLFQTEGGSSVKPFYEIGSPIFEKITINLDPVYYPGKTFVIEAKNVSDQNRYIQSAVLNGEKLSKPWFYHDELVKGGKLVLQMGDKPNKEWGSKPEDAPPSVSDTF